MLWKLDSLPVHRLLGPTLRQTILSDNPHVHRVVLTRSVTLVRIQPVRRAAITLSNKNGDRLTFEATQRNAGWLLIFYSFKNPGDLSYIPALQMRKKLFDGFVS